jgi:hypothetical protein
MLKYNIILTVIYLFFHCKFGMHAVIIVFWSDGDTDYEYQ